MQNMFPSEDVVAKDGSSCISKGNGCFKSRTVSCAKTNHFLRFNITYNQSPPFNILNISENKKQSLKQGIELVFAKQNAVEIDDVFITGCGCAQ